MRYYPLFATIIILLFGCDTNTSHAPYTKYIEGEWGFIDTAGNVIIDYGKIKAPGFFSQEGLAAAQDPVTSMYGYIDTSGNWVIKPAYDRAAIFKENRAAIKINYSDMWGYIDKTGKQVIPSKYVRAGLFSDGIAVVYDGTQEEYFIDVYGNHVFTQFEAIGQFSEGLAAARFKTSDKSGYIDARGNIVIEFKYNFTSDFSEGLAWVSMDKVDFFIDKRGNVVLDSIVYRREIIISFSGDFHDGRARIRYKEKYGYINRKGEVVIEPTFDWAEPFSEGMAKIKLGGRFGFIDTLGSIVVPAMYDLAWSYSNGLAAVNIGAKRMERVGKIFGGKWGFIDKAGKVVIPIKYEDVNPFSYGLASVCDGCRWEIVGY